MVHGSSSPSGSKLVWSGETDSNDPFRYTVFVQFFFFLSSWKVEKVAVGERGMGVSLSSFLQHVELVYYSLH
jgi:hypothetical protein